MICGQQHSPKAVAYAHTTSSSTHVPLAISTLPLRQIGAQNRSTKPIPPARSDLSSAPTAEEAERENPS